MAVVLVVDFAPLQFSGRFAVALRLRQGRLQRVSLNFKDRDTMSRSSSWSSANEILKTNNRQLTTPK
jgi:hypothetical protein